jgi:hypothetical protein
LSTRQDDATDEEKIKMLPPEIEVRERRERKERSLSSLDSSQPCVPLPLARKRRQAGREARHKSRDKNM